jgi:AraC-like DNA-binding protein
VADHELAVQRTMLATADPARVHEVTGLLYDSTALGGAGNDSEWRFEGTHLDAGRFSTTEIRLPVELTSTYVQTFDSVLIDVVLDGDVEIEQSTGIDSYQRGDAFVGGHPRADVLVRYRNVRLHVTSLSRGLFAEVCGTCVADSTAPAFEPAAANPGHASQWRKTTRFVENALTDPLVWVSPLVIGSLGRLLAATALTSFPNACVAPPAIEDHSDANPATLRRAIAFIEANPDLDLSLCDIARAASVTPRAVQIAFRRHLDTTPMAYLRRVRLDLAHEDLQAATPGDGNTVTAIASRWGYARASRFAADYRAAYGRPPHDVLREMPTADVTR